MSGIAGDFFSDYCALIGSPEQLARCREAASLPELLQLIKKLWNIPAAADNALLVELNRLNRIVIDDASIPLAGTWMPYRYHAESRSIAWCLPDGPAVEPFQDESISRYRRTVRPNTLLQPQTSLDILADQAGSVASAQPAGFIFHLSRCGSTLVSGCLSSLDSTNVMSESPVLTELFLDPQWDKAERQRHLRHLVDLQAGVFPDRPGIVIKWNAWDIFYWRLIHETYPQVPSLLLVRDPVEILASHQLSPGRHMSGDTSLAFLNPVFGMAPEPPLTLLDFRIQVLSVLLAEMQSIGTDASVLALDYSRLDLQQVMAICDSFRLPLGAAGAERIKTRLALNSKSPALPFKNDSAEKQNQFDTEETLHIRQTLMPAYRRFVESSHRNAIAH